MRRLLGALLMVAGTPVWAYGAWRFYRGDEGVGTVLVLGGGMLLVVGLAVWRRDPEIAGEGVLAALFDGLGRR